MFIDLTCKLAILLHVSVVEVQFILEVGTSIGALQGKSDRERELISKCICQILSKMSAMRSNDEIRPKLYVSSSSRSQLRRTEPNPETARPAFPFPCSSFFCCFLLLAPGNLLAIKLICAYADDTRRRRGKAGGEGVGNGIERGDSA